MSIKKHTAISIAAPNMQPEMLIEETENSNSFDDQHCFPHLVLLNQRAILPLHNGCKVTQG